MILLMGIAGSGKGTQGKMLADQHGFQLISMGDVLRMYITGPRRQRMLAGELLDDQEIIDIVSSVLQALPSGEEVILDGFPRTIPQAEWLLSQTKTGRFKIKNVFHLVASREAVKARLMSRGRIDDIEESIEERFNEYQRSTEPLLEWLNEHDVKVNNINAERPVDEINRDLVAHLKDS
jgi:adenylate kinase